MKYNWTNKNIIIVDDDDGLLFYLETLLLKYNAKTKGYTDGYQAIENLKSSNKTNLILMDINMPKINGIQTTLKIKEFNKNIPVIALTANEMPEDREMAHQTGFSAYVTKPINEELLLTIIDSFLQNN